MIPDEGFGAIVRLHDRLYSGPLAPELRLDLAYIPHVTVARHADPRLPALAGGLNTEGFAIAGARDTLDLVAREDGAIRTFARVALG